MLWLDSGRRGYVGDEEPVPAPFAAHDSHLDTAVTPGLSALMTSAPLLLKAPNQVLVVSTAPEYVVDQRDQEIFLKQVCLRIPTQTFLIVLATYVQSIVDVCNFSLMCQKALPRGEHVWNDVA